MSTINIEEHFVLCKSPVGLHRMAYREYWQGPNKMALPVLLCVHGLTRQGYDFDVLARALSDKYRVVCPDVVGRGHSDWMPAYTMGQYYQVPFYVADMVTLIARLNVEKVDYLGTSMGGLIGMGLASDPPKANVSSVFSPLTMPEHGIKKHQTAPQHNPPRHVINTLILNDVGTVISPKALQDLARYVGQPNTFATMNEAVAYFRRVHAPFGTLTDEQWWHLTEHSVRWMAAKQGQGEGYYALHYDPSIALPFVSSAAMTINLSEVFESINVPMLLLRGQESTLFSADNYQQMLRHKMTQGVEFKHCGHAPALMDALQIKAVRDFLLSTAY